VEAVMSKWMQPGVVAGIIGLVGCVATEPGVGVLEIGRADDATGEFVALGPGDSMPIALGA